MLKPNKHTCLKYSIFNISGMIVKILIENEIDPDNDFSVSFFAGTHNAVEYAVANGKVDAGADSNNSYDRMVEAAAADKRIGRTHLNVFHKGYRGYGGKCLPKDTKAIIQLANSKGVDLKLHKAAEDINADLMKQQNIEDPEKYGVRKNF